MPKKLLEIAAEIVQAQAAVGQMSPGEIEEALTRTFTTLQRMNKAEESGQLLDQGIQPSEEPEMTTPQDSIKEDRVICLECGAEMKQLTAKHLGSHELDLRSYKKKYGFPMKTSLVAKSITRARSKAAKKRGLPPRLREMQEERRRMKESAPVQEEMIQPEMQVPVSEPVMPEPVVEEKKKRGGRKKKVEA